MSLTSFLKNNADLRILIDQTFEKPDASIKADRLAEPQTTNYALIGTAFDYVLRFKLEQEYDGVNSKPWIAHQGLQTAEVVGLDTDTASGETLADVLSEAERLHQEYLDSGEMTDELLAATLDLGRLDWIYRSGRISDDFGTALEGDITDLRTLYEIIQKTSFRGQTRCF